jgi:hypothetical protein
MVTISEWRGTHVWLLLRALIHIEWFEPSQSKTQPLLFKWRSNSFRFMKIAIFFSEFWYAHSLYSIVLFEPRVKVLMHQLNCF